MKRKENWQVVNRFCLILLFILIHYWYDRVGYLVCKCHIKIKNEPPHELCFVSVMIATSHKKSILVQLFQWHYPLPNGNVKGRPIMRIILCRITMNSKSLSRKWPSTWSVYFEFFLFNKLTIIDSTYFHSIYKKLIFKPFAKYNISKTKKRKIQRPVWSLGWRDSNGARPKSFPEAAPPRNVARRQMFYESLVSSSLHRNYQCVSLHGLRSEIFFHLKRYTSKLLSFS